ncbi:MAG: hypothetical protein H7099_04135 [Gemmatimonadaceae bacterium]|nr:hypothetical protein [Gemmatimonadaceae bacterium]
MRLKIVILCAALVPAVLVAQGGMGGMGGMGGRRGGGMGQMGPRGGGGLPKFATAKELERFNAADALLLDQKKLKLTEAQVTALTSLRATLYEKNAELLVRYDSVRRNYKPPAALTDTRGPADEASMPSQTEMVALRDQMLLMMSLGEQLMERRPEQVASCLALVDDAQKDRATKVLEDQTDELRKQIPERPSPNGRAPRR